MSLLATLRLEYTNASSPVAFSKGSILTCNSPRILSYLSWRSIYYFCSLWSCRLHCKSFCWHTYTKSLEVIGHQKVVHRHLKYGFENTFAPFICHNDHALFLAVWKLTENWIMARSSSSLTRLVPSGQLITSTCLLPSPRSPCWYDYMMVWWYH